MGYKGDMNIGRASSSVAYRRRRRRRQRRRARFIRTAIIASLSAATIILFGKEVLAHSWKNIDNASREESVSWQSLLSIADIREADLDIVCDGLGDFVIPLKSSKGVSDKYDFSKPVPGSAVVENAYFDDAVFIGDSRTEGLLINTGLSNATFYVQKGLMVDTVFSEPVIHKNGQKLSVMDALKETTFSKVYIMFGVNETGWVYSRMFQEKYGEMIDTIREINPRAIIYIQAILPVSDKVSSTHSYITNKKIMEYNELLQSLAEEKQVYYLDTKSAVADKNGSLPENAAVDGIHLVKEYCGKWLEYLKLHTITQ